MGADNLMSFSKMDITSKIRCPKSTYPLYTCITHNCDLRSATCDQRIRPAFVLGHMNGLKPLENEQQKQ